MRKLLILLICIVSCTKGNGKKHEFNKSGIQTVLKNMENDGRIPVLDYSKNVNGQEDPNMVRHDINVWINKQNLNAEKKLALSQLAKSVQKTIVLFSQTKRGDPKSVQMAKNSSSVEGKAVNCIFSKFDHESAYKYIHNIEQFTVNTKERIAAYRLYMIALSGSVLDDEIGDTCEK